MITNGGALVTGQRTILSDSTPLTHWHQDATAAEVMLPASLRLINGEWYYDTSNTASDGSLMTQDSTGDLYFAATADLGTAGYTAHKAVVRAGSTYASLY